ncbi:ABC transporter ATP-binding protein [uncultured Pseudokineococcus sp.]|uniref:ABC transporter ATP-binding protein n=1 Tax=uncultured Pseudokineococcus sp. TaxID=1642928 RepID=UPI00344905AB
MLRGVDLHAADGRVLGLLGPNGSGKTTLLRALYGALVPDRGSVRVDGEDLSALSARQVARRMAVVVQEHGDHVPMLVADAVLLGRTPHHRGLGGRTEADVEAVTEALERVGALHLAGRRVGDLSGGERQRVLIARALAQATPHLLLDEPTNHLDVRYQHELLHLLRGLGATVVVVLHDLALAARYCDDALLLHQGRVAAVGGASDVLVPEVLEDVYRMRVRRADDEHGPHLTFSLPGLASPP